MDKTKNYWLLKSIIILCFFLHSLFHITLFWYIGIAFLVLSLSIGFDGLVYLGFFLLPNESIMKIQGESFSTLSYFLFVISLVFAVNKIKTLDFKYWRLASFHIITVLFVSVYISSLSLLLPCIRIIFIGYYFLTEIRNKIDYYELIKNYSVGVFVATVLGMIYGLSDGTLFNGIFGGVSGDRNYFGTLIAVNIPICLLCILRNRIKTRESVFYFISLIFSLFSVVLSGSRTVVVSLLFSILLVFLVFGDNKKAPKVLLISVLIAVSILVLYFKFADSFHYIFARFSNDSVVTASGRTEIWQYYLEEYVHSGIGILIGNGPSNLLYNSGIYDAVAHNTLIEYLYCEGLLGCFSILMLITYVYKSIKSNHRVKLYSAMPLCVVCLQYFSIDGLYSNQLLLLLILSFVTMVAMSEEHCK